MSVHNVKMNNFIASVIVVIARNSQDRKEDAMSHPTKISPTDKEAQDTQEVDTDATDPSIEPSRHPFIAWAIASLRIMWSSLRHPGHPVWVDYRTGKVWLKRD